MSALSPELIPLDAPTLVEASAGTGKTYAITTYFVRAILEDDLTPDKILVVTYTKAATAELRARARARLASALTLIDGPPDEPDALFAVVSDAVERLGAPAVERKLRSALGQMDQAAILTIHGFCQRLLQEHPLSFGVELEFEVAENAASLHADLAVDFWSTELYDQPEWLLQRLRADKVTINHLERLAKIATMPGVEVIGPAPRPMEDGAVRQVFELQRQAGVLWREHRGAILELLQSGGLYASIYKEESIRELWAPELDGLFKRTTLETLPKYFRWLCTTNLAKKTKKTSEPPAHPFFDACEELVAAHEHVDPMLAYAVHAFQQRFCDFVRDRSRARRDESAIYSFDDLLTTVHATVTEVEAVARTICNAYPIALIDEFQDTDSVQYGIFRAIYGDGAAVYVGDPKQAIYAFRGADIFSYIEAAKDVGERRHTLGTNRRSDPGVVRAVNALFSRLAPPFLIEGIDFEDASAHEIENRTTLAPSLDVVLLGADDLDGPTASCVAPIVANEVALMLESGALIEGRPLEAGDIAVLCRSNKQTIAVTQALRDLNLPTSLDGGASVLSTELAADLGVILEAALLPGDSRAVRRALLTSLLAVSAFDLASMDDDTWSAWVSRFREWNDTWHTQGVLRCLKDMLSSTGAEVLIASRSTARRDLTDLLHLQELLLRGERERDRDPVGLMQWFRRLNDGTREEGMLAMEDLQQRPDAEAGAVRVTTIHKSKGLEYGIVFCPFTWNDAGLFGFDHRAVKFHDQAGKLKIDLGSEDQADHLTASKREAASEALRLLYVAVTRAKHQCTLFWGPGYRWKDSAFAYLLHDADSLGKLDEDAMRADVEAFAAKVSGDAGCRPPRSERATPRHDEHSGPELRARPKLRRFDHSSRIASFTSLTGHDDNAPERSAPAATSPLFADLPGGARTGLLLHSIFERAELDALGAKDAHALIERQLALFGFDSHLTGPVQRDLVTVVSTPIAPDSSLPALAELGRDRQLRELEFTLAVERPKIEDLAEVLKQHGAPADAPGYHERLARVGGNALRGFLRGFIDLMFEWEGRWYVADYKSNRLPTYEPSSVIEAAQREHYVLQGQLYSIAAHRYLRQRDPSYDPERNWGGALFLFVRGMNGPERAGSSVFFDKQSPELLDAVDAWLGGPDGSR